MKNFLRHPDAKAYRVGRCSSCKTRPAFAWRTGTLTLDDARCLRCDRLLDKTSRMVRGGFYLIEDEALIAQLKRGSSSAYTRKLEALSIAIRFEDDAKPELAEQWRRMAEQAGETHERLAAALRREVLERLEVTA